MYHDHEEPQDSVVGFPCHQTLVDLTRIVGVVVDETDDGQAYEQSRVVDPEGGHSLPFFEDCIGSCEYDVDENGDC